MDYPIEKRREDTKIILFIKDAHIGKHRPDDRLGPIGFKKNLVADYLSNDYCEFWVRQGVAVYLVQVEK